MKIQSLVSSFATLILAVSLLLTSCVSSSKFKDIQQRNTFLVEENLNLKNAKKSEGEMRAKYAETEHQLQQTEDLLKSLNARYTGILASYEQLQKEYEKLTDQNTNILSTTAGEKSDLEQELADKQDELDRKAKELAERAADIEIQTNELSNLNSVLSEREVQIQKLNESLEAQRFILQDLKFRISNALSGFSDEQLVVEQKANGKVYISLSQELLFSKGSNKIDANGKAALEKLAEVLSINNDVEILVEGHTDSDGTAERNWDLSVTRATEVVKIMQAAGVSPSRLTASGKALYVPIASNENEVDKAKNRRTEIILSPKLDKLFELINSQE